ncbi:MAG: tetratricopeptide repeat protein [Desulfobacterales bacterium]
MDFLNNHFIYTAAGALSLLIGSILLILVLIKSFTAGGVRHGLLGLLSGGVYTFVWGWLGARRLKMTMTMILWTICIMAGGALVYMTGPAQMLQSIPWASELGLLASAPVKKTTARVSPKHPVKKQRDTSDAPKPPVAALLQDADWNTQSAALWQDARYVDVKQAVALLEKAIEENPNFAEAYNNRGNAYRDMQKYALAMQDYNKAVSLKPTLAQAFNNRGNIYFDQDNFKMAIADYNKALDLNATYALAYLNRGLAHHGLHQDELVCPDLNKACELGDCDGIDWARKNGICR